ATPERRVAPVAEPEPRMRDLLERAAEPQSDARRAERHWADATSAEPEPEAEPAPTERVAARVDPRLQLVGLLFRDPAGRERVVDLIEGCRLRRLLQLRGGDAEVLRERIDERGRPGARSGRRERRAARKHGHDGTGDDRRPAVGESAHDSSQ